MKALVFLFFFVIFWIFKAIASVGSATVNIAKSAYETVNNPPKTNTVSLEKQLLGVYIETTSMIYDELTKYVLKEEVFKNKTIELNSKDKDIFCFLLLFEIMSSIATEIENKYLNQGRNPEFVEMLSLLVLGPTYFVDTRLSSKTQDSLEFNKTEKKGLFFYSFREMQNLYLENRRLKYKYIGAKVIQELNLDLNKAENVAFLAAEENARKDSLCYSFAYENYNTYKKTGAIDKELQEPSSIITKCFGIIDLRFDLLKKVDDLLNKFQYK